MKGSGGGGDFDVVRFSTSVMGLSETPLCPEKKPPGAVEAVSERERQTHRPREKTNPFPPLGCHS